MSRPATPRVRAFVVGLVACGIFVLLVVAAAFLVRLNRPGAPPESAPAEPSDQGEPAEPAGKAAPVISATGTTDEDAVFGQDETGAAEAAVAYAALPQQWLYLSDDEVAAAVAEIAAPEAAEQLTDEVVGYIGDAREGLTQSSGRVWWLVHPLAWRVDYFRPQEATVSVWTLTLLSAVDVALPQAEWQTTTFDLVWTDEGWRVDRVGERPGPTPMTGPGDRPWEPLAFDDALDGFTRVGERSGGGS